MKDAGVQFRVLWVINAGAIIFFQLPLFMAVFQTCAASFLFPSTCCREVGMCIMTAAVMSILHAVWWGVFLILLRVEW